MMKLDETTLLELEDYIKHLEETIGLKTETVLDFYSAISKYRKKLKEAPNHKP